MDPSSADVWLHMGLAQARREDFTRAQESLERAARLAAGDEDIERWLTWVRTQQAQPRLRRGFGAAG